MRVRDWKVINLALQGAGAHGAFTWGVLDRLLNDERLAREGISGTSSGAMNAVALAYGLTIGGRDEARRMLASLWERIGINILPGYAHASTRYRPQRRLALEGALALAHACSPYELNPPGIWIRCGRSSPVSSISSDCGRNASSSFTLPPRPNHMSGASCSSSTTPGA